MLKSLTLLFVFISLSGSETALDNPEDFAIALRETQIYADLKPYAEIIATAQPKQFFPLLKITKDQYGIYWAEVEVEEEVTGYLTDMISVRRGKAELTNILKNANIEELSGWTEEDLEYLGEGKIRSGLTETQLLFVSGHPSEIRARSNWKEYIYPRTRVLMLNGTVQGFSEIVRLAGDKWIQPVFTVDDPEFIQAGGQWEEKNVNLIDYLQEKSGSGSARYRFRMPVDGLFSFSAIWLADAGNSPKVQYRISSKGELLTSFKANHRLHYGKWIKLGDLPIAANTPVLIEISSLDGLPFSVGQLQVSYINDAVDITNKVSE